MAQTNTVLTQMAVKRLSGKAQTNANNSLGQEPKGSTVQTTATTVFAEALPNNPAQTLYLTQLQTCLLYTSPSPRDRQKSRMPSSA